MSSFEWPSSGGSSPNASVGQTGATAPTSATEIGIIDGTGKLQGVSASNPVPITGTVQVTAPINPNGSFVQASISGASTISVPANAVGFILEADSANTDFMRWCVSSTASTSNGMKLEAGRDTGYLPMAKNISICPGSGTQLYTIQWVLNQ